MNLIKILLKAFAFKYHQELGKKKRISSKRILAGFTKKYIGSIFKPYLMVSLLFLVLPSFYFLSLMQTTTEDSISSFKFAHIVFNVYILPCPIELQKKRSLEAAVHRCSSK